MLRKSTPRPFLKSANSRQTRLCAYGQADGSKTCPNPQAMRAAACAATSGTQPWQRLCFPICVRAKCVSDGPVRQALPGWSLRWISLNGRGLLERHSSTRLPNARKGDTVRNADPLYVRSMKDMTTFPSRSRAWTDPTGSFPMSATVISLSGPAGLIARLARRESARRRLRLETFGDALHWRTPYAPQRLDDIPSAAGRVVQSR